MFRKLSWCVCSGGRTGCVCLGAGGSGAPSSSLSCAQRVQARPWLCTACLLVCTVSCRPCVGCISILFSLAAPLALLFSAALCCPWCCGSCRRPCWISLPLSFSPCEMLGGMTSLAVCLPTPASHVPSPRVPLPGARSSTLDGAPGSRFLRTVVGLDCNCRVALGVPPTLAAGCRTCCASPVAY